MDHPLRLSRDARSAEKPRAQATADGVNRPAVSVLPPFRRKRLYDAVRARLRL